MTVQVFAEDGTLLGGLTFASHPEFDDFELYQRKETDELLEIVRTRLESGMAHHSFAEAWQNGIDLMLRFNGSDQERPHLDKAK